jgi:UDP-glucose 4-epimerase
MKCLVLGGGGFLGSHLSGALLEQGHKVRVFDRARQNRHLPQEIEWREGDFSSSQEVQSALDSCDVVYHLISTTIPKDSNENPAYDVESNVVSTVRMLEATHKLGVRKVVFVSSGGTVYGVPKRVPIQEGDAGDPVCSYGIGKLMIEKYLHLFHVLHGLDYCILRMANPFGERQSVAGAQGAAAAFLYRAMKKKPIEIWGDGEVVRDYLYVKDAARALVMAMDCTAEERVFNIGAGEGRSLNEVVAAIERVAGRAVERKYLPGRPFDVPVNVLDISRAKRVLKWKPEVSFEEGLRRTWEWMQSTYGS